MPLFDFYIWGIMIVFGIIALMKMLIPGNILDSHRHVTIIVGSFCIAVFLVTGILMFISSLLEGGTTEILKNIDYEKVAFSFALFALAFDISIHVPSLDP